MASMTISNRMPALPEPGTEIERLAREVHAAWRDGMLRQGRPVPVERLEWETLSDADKVLDRYIYARVAAAIFAVSLNATPMVGECGDDPRERDADGRQITHRGGCHCDRRSEWQQNTV